VTFRSLHPESVHGRQAEARRNDLVVLEAARDVFTALGADAPISAVAERAGVGMGTLYRRYGSKTELLQHLCVLAMDRRSAARLGEIVARAHRDGSLRPDVTALDVTWLIEQFSRRPPDPVEPDEERNVRARLVAIALDGLRTQAGQALPGRPPSRARYVRRWSRTP